MGRMLLSHNFNLVTPLVPIISRAEFASIFADGFADREDIAVAEIEHSHWRVELKFGDEVAAATLGRDCLQVLLSARQKQRDDGLLDYDTLILGGMKVTPPLGNSPVELRTGEWGVDVVETEGAEKFLTDINWTAIAGTKQPGQVFEEIAVRGVL